MSSGLLSGPAFAHAPICYTKSTLCPRSNPSDHRPGDPRSAYSVTVSQPSKELGDELAPEFSISKKHKTVETVGPIQKIGPITPNLYQDCLGKLVASLSENLSAASLWEDFVKNHQGKSYLAPDIDNIQHSA